MAKELPSSFLSQSSLEDHPIFEWIEKNSRTIITIVIGSALLIGLLYRYASSQNSEAQQDYFQAANAIEMMKDSSKFPSALTEIQAILARRPELDAKYDGILAQNLLLEKNVPLAATYAEKNFNRIQKDANPLFLTYAKNSLLIGEGRTSEALANALSLKEKLANHQFIPNLYIFNLIRIAMLQHALNEKDAEAKSWEELLQIARLEHPLNFDPATVEKVMEHFGDQGISLTDFIQASKS